MRITPDLFGAYLKCPTKCFLRAHGEPPTGNAYAEWIRNQNESYHSAGVARLKERIPREEWMDSTSDPADLKAAKWCLAVDFPVRTHNLETRLHALERVPSEGRGKPAQFVPIRFICTSKVTREDKLMMALDALVLSEMLAREVCPGRIIHGEDHAALKVKTSALAEEVRKLVRNTTELLRGNLPPDLILNRHCGECEFQTRCRQKAIEKDDLSLLSHMAAKERKELNSKGIFTVTQLSYTFRPRRRPKKLAGKREKYHHSLKALAIRECKIHIVGRPELKIEGTPVYMDVEGVPDRDFYYLIGVQIKTGDGFARHSMWADDPVDERRIWTDFLELLSTVENPVLIHFGSYETTFLKRMCADYGGPPQTATAVVKALEHPVNLLSVVFAQVYFPTYSNGLKEVAKFFGFNWSEPNVSGAQSVIWRYAWEQSRDPTIKQKLTTYNLEDCQALEIIARNVSALSASTEEAGIESRSGSIVSVASLKRETMWPRFSSPISEFEQINNAASWEYQRDRIYVRSSKEIKRVAIRESAPRKRVRQNAKPVMVPRKAHCPICQEKGLPPCRTGKRVLHDIHIGRSGVQRRVVEYYYDLFWCPRCQRHYGAPKECWPGSKFGRNLVAYFLYHVVELCIPMATIKKITNRLLGFGLTDGVVPSFKRRAAKYYSETRQTILNRLVKGGVLHVDETRVSIKGMTAYVWVFTNLHEVAYVYSDTREAGLVQTLLCDFKGVLVSDFYAAYDSLNCPQQKCLIHLIRDLNTEILDQPYDEQLKEIVRGFAELLKPVVETVDRFGLKKHFLRKHLVFVERFYCRLANTDYQSEAAVRCKQRFEKNREKLFTFLAYDGVPWNNNNAEHAIKAFAKLRDVVQGSLTAKAVEEYLVLLSVCQTCVYSGLDFLDFLRSGEKDIEAFAKTKRRAGKIPPVDAISTVRGNASPDVRT